MNLDKIIILTKKTKNFFLFFPREDIMHIYTLRIKRLNFKIKSTNPFYELKKNKTPQTQP